MSFALIAQQLGFSIQQIAAELDKLPQGRTPSASDWRQISGRFKIAIEARIAALQQTRDVLNGCIGCGCLSLKKCAVQSGRPGGPVGNRATRRAGFARLSRRFIKAACPLPPQLWT
ncbi:MerR family DNA-binding protein [Sphingomonas sp. QA11]|uniref:MerR family DNA-binding protein n=1 Tax=Sphingomonas sp. QA11 TaxID=2950605 RepID=UPI00300E1282